EVLVKVVGAGAAGAEGESAAEEGGLGDGLGEGGAVGGHGVRLPGEAGSALLHGPGRPRAVAPKRDPSWTRTGVAGKVVNLPSAAVGRANRRAEGASGGGGVLRRREEAGGGDDPAA